MESIEGMKEKHGQTGEKEEEKTKGGETLASNNSYSSHSDKRGHV